MYFNTYICLYGSIQCNFLYMLVKSWVATLTTYCNILTFKPYTQHNCLLCQTLPSSTSMKKPGGRELRLQASYKREEVVLTRISLQASQSRACHLRHLLSCVDCDFNKTSPAATLSLSSATTSTFKNCKPIRVCNMAPSVKCD